MSTRPLGIAAVLVVCSWSAATAGAPSQQEGSKLVGSGAIGGAYQGSSVAISSNGNTAVVGGYADNGGVGAAWVYTRTAGVWSQQGAKLVGNDTVGTSYQGRAVAISADGNTVLVGGHGDHGYTGAAWVYTRSGGVWSQQGAKLVGTGAVGNAEQGWSVALSGDGNTALLGAQGDNGYAGATWVFTRAAGVWSQQGAKLLGTGAAGIAEQGASVAVSADGNTAIVGGLYDNSSVGAAWVFTRSAGVWSQQGLKLIGSGAVGPQVWQGCSVAISADGNTSIVGGLYDNNLLGAAWVFTRSGGVWSQQGNKLVGTGSVGLGTAGTDVEQGTGVALSGDGNTAMVGGPIDAGYLGASWVYTRTAGVWSQHGAKLVGTGEVMVPEQGGSIAMSADGSTAIVGGDYDNVGSGAAWVFIDPSLLAVPSPTMHPAALQLAPPFPNPGDNEFAISFSLPRDEAATVGVYDAEGRFVRTLVAGSVTAGGHTIRWDGRTSSGRAATDGIYFVALRAGGDQMTRRFVVLR